MEENKLFVIIVAIVAIVAISSLVITVEQSTTPASTIAGQAYKVAPTEPNNQYVQEVAAAMKTQAATATAQLFASIGTQPGGKQND